MFTSEGATFCRQDALLSRSAASYIRLLAPALLAQATFEVFKRCVVRGMSWAAATAASPAVFCTLFRPQSAAHFGGHAAQLQPSLSPPEPALPAAGT